MDHRIVELWSSGRHLASGSEGPGFESCLCQVDVESLGKALYMHFLNPPPPPPMCKKRTRISRWIAIFPCFSLIVLVFPISPVLVAAFSL